MELLLKVALRVVDDPMTLVRKQESMIIVSLHLTATARLMIKLPVVWERGKERSKVKCSGISRAMLCKQKRLK